VAAADIPGVKRRLRHQAIDDATFQSSPAFPDHESGVSIAAIKVPPGCHVLGRNKMRVSIVLGSLAALLALTACQTLTPEERRARDEATCRGYGFRPGTDPMAGCLLDLEMDRRADNRAWQAQMNRDMFYRPVVVERRIIVQPNP
jgi:hypothetical protein